MKHVKVELSGRDLDELLQALGDQLEDCRREEQRRGAGPIIDLFIRLQAAGETLPGGVWVDSELPAWALEQLRRAAVTAASVPELEKHAKELQAQVNSLRQKASAKARKHRAAAAHQGKARTSGGASHAAGSRSSAPTGPVPLVAPAAGVVPGSSSASHPTAGAAAAQGDGGA